MSAEDSVLDAAIQWQIRLRYNEADAQTWAAFESWRALHPSNNEAWQRLQTLGARLRPPSEQLSAQTAATVLRQVDRERTRRTRRRSLSVLGLAMTGGFAAWTLQDAQPVQRLLADYSAGLGERRRVVLPDGGVLSLNTGSAVDVIYGATERRIVLRAGEIYVVSGVDAARRPFVVSSYEGRLEALGTRFLVRQFDGFTQLVVDDGTVALWPRLAERPAPAAVARAGQHYAMYAKEANSQTKFATGVQNPSAWIDGVISVRDVALSTFLHELSRYYGPIYCDPSVASLSVSGVFQIDDPRGALALLSQALPIRITEQNRWWRRMTRVEARS